MYTIYLLVFFPLANGQNHNKSMSELATAHKHSTQKTQSEYHCHFWNEIHSKQAANHAKSPNLEHYTI
jgi:hypothetical protein